MGGGVESRYAGDNFPYTHAHTHTYTHIHAHTHLEVEGDVARIHPVKAVYVCVRVWSDVW